MPDALQLLETRRTISAAALGEPGPTDADIETIIRIASRVPDHGKLTPWRFILYRGDQRAILDEKITALFLAANPEAVEGRMALERNRFSRVPLTIGVLSRAAPHAKIPEWEQVLSAGAATMNLVLAAHALGFSAQWLTEWCCYDVAAAGLLGAREGERFAGLVAIGTATVPAVDRPRPAFADIASDWQV